MALSDDLQRAPSRGRAARPQGTAGVWPRWPGLVWAAAGLYLPSVEPAHENHDLTQKIRASKLSREHDPEFARQLAALAFRWTHFNPDVIASIPPRPGHGDRFRHIRVDLAQRTGAIDAGPLLTQTHTVEGYRSMTVFQRRAAARKRFSTSAAIPRARVLLFDDVITSGGQAADAARALIEAGAADVRFVALARATTSPASAQAPHDTGGAR